MPFRHQEQRETTMPTNKMHSLFSSLLQHNASEGESCHGSCGQLRHALAFADELWRRSMQNKEASFRIAASLGLDEDQVRASIALLRIANRVPSKERLALVVMKDHGLDDSDVAEIFGQTAEWVAKVRRRGSDIRGREPIDETMIPWVYEWDMNLKQIYAAAEELRKLRPDTNPCATTTGNIRHFLWSRNTKGFRQR